MHRAHLWVQAVYDDRLLDVLQHGTVEGARTRRLEPSITLPDRTVREGEEVRLLKHAGPRLRALIVAALSTGCLPR